MDMRQIRQFIAVVEHGNVLRAAQAIHLSQPALSKSILNLEAELGVPLLTRGPRGVTPTIYGTLLLRHARLLHNHGERAVAEIRALKAGAAGHLRLGVANFAISFLPRVVANLLATSPGLTFEVVDGTYEGLTALVRQGSLDAVVAGFPPLHRAEDLVHEDLVAAELLLVGGANHPLRAARPLSWQILGEQRWVLANRPQAFVDLIDVIFRAAGVRPPTPLITSGSMMFLRAVLLEGELVTVLPRGIVAADLASGALVSMPFPTGTAPTTEGIIYRADAVHPPILFALIEAIKAEAAATAAGATATFPVDLAILARTPAATAPRAPAPPEATRTSRSAPRRGRNPSLTSRAAPEQTASPRTPAADPRLHRSRPTPPRTRGGSARTRGKR